MLLVLSSFATNDAPTMVQMFKPPALFVCKEVVITAIASPFVGRGRAEQGDVGFNVVPVEKHRPSFATYHTTLSVVCDIKECMCVMWVAYNGAVAKQVVPSAKK